MKAIILFSCLLVTVHAADLGAACTPKDGTKADCTDANAICPAAGNCECKKGYTAASATCIDHTIGAVCTPKDGTKADCDDANAICPAAGKCECNDGYSGTAGGPCSPNGGGRQSASFWLLTGSIITMLMTFFHS